MRRFLIALLVAVAGYVIGAVGGGWLVSMLSSNTHDVSVEAAMTGAFVTGPLVAVVAFIAGFVLAKRPQRDNAR